MLGLPSDVDTNRIRPYLTHEEDVNVGLAHRDLLKQSHFKKCEKQTDKGLTCLNSKLFNLQTPESCTAFCAQHLRHALKTFIITMLDTELIVSSSVKGQRTQSVWNCNRVMSYFHNNRFHVYKRQMGWEQNLETWNEEDEYMTAYNNLNEFEKGLKVFYVELMTHVTAFFEPVDGIFGTNYQILEASTLFNGKKLKLNVDEFDTLGIDILATIYFRRENMEENAEDIIEPNMEENIEENLEECKVLDCFFNPQLECENECKRNTQVVLFDTLDHLVIHPWFANIKYRNEIRQVNNSKFIKVFNLQREIELEFKYEGILPSEILSNYKVLDFDSYEWTSVEVSILKTSKENEVLRLFVHVLHEYREIKMWKQDLHSLTIIIENPLHQEQPE